MSLILFSLPFVWGIINDYSDKKAIRRFVKHIGEQPIDLSFEKLRLKTFHNGKKINLYAPQAYLYDLNISKILLQKPLVTLHEADKQDVTLSAEDGLYLSKNNMITLSNKVLIKSNQIYNIKADELFIDLNNFAFTIPNGIDAHYKNNSLKAKNVELLRKSNKAIFSGGVKLRIMPSNL